MDLNIKKTHILEKHPMHVAVNGYDIVVPEPAVFIIQKLLVYPNRKPEYKIEKDIVAINELLPYVLKSEIHSERLKYIYNALSDKDHKRVNEVCAERRIELF